MEPLEKMLFIGHASLRFTTDSGQVIYVDPYHTDGGAYGPPADFLLVTHQHFDHNAVDKVTKKPGCLVITQAEALKNGKYNRFEKDGVVILAVPAANKNHPADQCVGYILKFDGISVYCAGDTSKIPQMADLAAQKLDYALLPVDGVYNMDPAEASACAQMIGARRNIPYHTAADNGQNIRDHFSDENARRFLAPGRLIVRHGEEITL